MIFVTEEKTILNAKFTPLSSEKSQEEHEVRERESNKEVLNSSWNG